MLQPNIQKLTLTSKTMLLILRILFVLLILMATLPWIFPTNQIGKFILSLQGFNNSISSSHKNINLFMLTLTPLSRFFGMAGSIIALLPLMLGTRVMINLSKNYLGGRVFNLANAKSYSHMGIIYLASALFLQPVYQIFFSLCTTINNPAGQRFIAFSISVENLTAMFFAIVLVVIGQVMKLGHQLSEEHDLTI